MKIACLVSEAHHPLSGSVHVGSLSLMQMVKISAALCDYRSNKRLFYAVILKHFQLDHHRMLLLSLNYDSQMNTGLGELL